MNQNSKSNRQGSSEKPTGSGAVKPSDQDKEIAAAHQLLMSKGELIFTLRDVHSYWSTPQMSEHDMEALEAARLIERSPTPICSIRLTKLGAAVKDGGSLKTS